MAQYQHENGRIQLQNDQYVCVASLASSYPLINAVKQEGVCQIRKVIFPDFPNLYHDVICAS